MSDIQEWLDKGRALADQATEGPWEAGSSEATMNDRSEWKIGKHNRPQVLRSVMRGDDTTFIADARTRLPQALNALQAVMEIHKPFHADHYYVGMNGGSLHRFVLRCSGCEESGGIEGYPCPTVRAIQTELERKEPET